MSAEDDLRALLTAEASQIHPAGDGLSLIRQRIARKRRLRLIALPSAGAVALGVAVAVFLTGTSGTEKLIQKPTTSSPTPTAAPTTGPTPGHTSPYTGPELFAYTSPDKDDVIRHWLTLVGIEGVPLAHTCESCDVVGIAVAGTHVGDAVLARSFLDSGISYHLVGVNGAGMTITSPEAGAVVLLPVTVTGTLNHGVDENVLLRLFADGSQVGQASAPAGSAVPWSAPLSSADSAWRQGAIVATTASNKDGAITRIGAVPITRAVAPTSPVATAACDRTSLEVSLINDPGGHYTGDSSVVITFHNVGASACSLEGYAQLVFRAADGSVLPFDLRHGSGQAFQDPGALPITVAPGSTAAIGLTKYRCDLSGGVATRSLTISLPGLSTTLSGLDGGSSAGVTFCGVGDPGVELNETALVGSVNALFR